jgi:hypothetical protein
MLRTPSLFLFAARKLGTYIAPLSPTTRAAGFDGSSDRRLSCHARRCAAAHDFRVVAVVDVLHSLWYGRGHDLSAKRLSRLARRFVGYVLQVQLRVVRPGRSVIEQSWTAAIGGKVLTIRLRKTKWPEAWRAMIEIAPVRLIRDDPVYEVLPAHLETLTARGIDYEVVSVRPRRTEKRRHGTDD